MPHPGIVQALFGAALWLYVVACFYRRLRRPPPMLPSDLYAFSRRLARVVYTVLYTLMFARLTIGMLSAAPDRPMQLSFDRVQGYLCLSALATAPIRALSVACRHFVMNSAGAPAVAIQPNGQLR